MIRPRSLASRLAVTALLWCLLVLTAGGLLLSNIFKRSVEQGFDEQLLVMMDNLIASTGLNPDAADAPAPDLLDKRFERALSGWYWQVAVLPKSDRPQILFASRSLFDERIAFEPLARAPGDYWFRDRDPGGKSLRILVKTVSLSDQEQRLSFLLTGDRSQVEHQIATFNRTLVWSMILLALGLVAAVVSQVKVGLRPLARLQSGLKDIRSGQASRLSDDFPHEISPLTNELNALLAHNGDIVARARSHVSNLAHALKTPLTILRNESAQPQGPSPDIVRDQAEHMQDHVNRYLVLARIAGATGAHGRSTPVKPVVDQLIRTLTILHRSKALDVETDIPDWLAFKGDSQDLEEMLGNLLDNAIKWSRSKVRVRAQAGGERFRLSVEDDGPGLTADECEQVLQPGVRLDERVPGTGLGLSIVADYAGAYATTLSLERSPLGGLNAALDLPLSQAAPKSPAKDLVDQAQSVGVRQAAPRPRETSGSQAAAPADTRSRLIH